MLSLIILSSLILATIKSQEEIPVTTDTVSSSLNTDEGVINSDYFVDYFEISSTELIVNAYPLDECTLISLIDEYKYATFTCNTEGLLIQEFYKSSDCSSDSGNTTLRTVYTKDSSVGDGDVGSFHCNGDSYYISVDTCNDNSVTNGLGNLLIVPDVCYYDSSSSSAYSFQWSCITNLTNIDDSFDYIRLSIYNGASASSCTSGNSASSSLKSSGTCLNIFTSPYELNAIINTEDAMCSWQEYTASTTTTTTSSGSTTTSGGTTTKESNSHAYSSSFSFSFAIFFFSFAIFYF